MPLISVNPSLTFEIWAIDFVGPFPNVGQTTSVRYIIIDVENVTKWDESNRVESCTKEVETKIYI
jgi:hypothetical protein